MPFFSKQPASADSTETGAESLGAGNGVKDEADEPGESKKQPLWHVVVLFVFTMSAYSIVWFYKNWRDLAAYLNESTSEPDVTLSEQTLNYFKNGSAWLRTFGIMLPIAQLYFVTMFFINAAAIGDAGSFRKKHAVFCGLTVTLSMMAFLCLGKLPDNWRLFYLFAALPLVVAQSWVNSFWRRHESKDLVVRQAFSVSELVTIFFGAIALGLVVIGPYVSR